MIQYLFNTGSSLDLATLSQTLGLDTQEVMNDEIRILVDTSVARTVILPAISSAPVRNMKVTIVDVMGFAVAHNITIQGAIGTPNDAINGTSTFVINSAFGAFRFEPLDVNDWFTVNVGAGGGGGTALAVNMTYSQLIAAIGSNSLITGQRILLTDYATAYYLQYSGTPPTGIGGEQVNVGAVEPLLLTAISMNEVSLVAESISNSQDLILYSPIMPDRDYDYAAAQGKGCIVFRMDRALNISRDYDWRTIVFRRWETVIGNGHYWSYTPVAGAAFVDLSPFPQGYANNRDNNVGSPLALHTSTSIPYWLDNTILNAGSVILNNYGVSFANTLTSTVPASSSIAGNMTPIMVYNVIVQRSIYANEIVNLSNNRIIDLTNSNNMTGNRIENCSDNILTGLNGNAVGVIGNNTCSTIRGNISKQIALNNMPSNSIYSNIVDTILSNTCTGDIDSNDGFDIDTNSCGKIENNLVDNIASNTSRVTQIIENIASNIQGNSNVGAIQDNSVTESISRNTNRGNVSSNTGNTISGNDISGSISGNIVGDISGNTTLVTAIDRNIGQGIIGNNNTGSITFNMANQIQSNSNNGNIWQNTGYLIESNSNGGHITNNTGQIINNSNAGGIVENMVYMISANNLAGNISNNTGNIINGNTGAGGIMQNLVTDISNNDVAGGISQNTGFEYINNTTTGNILGNMVGYINNNGEAVSSTSNIQYNCGMNFDNLTLNGEILDCNGRIDLCTITAPIRKHTFVSSVYNTTVNPTANMQSGAIATQSIYQQSDSKFYEMVLNAGVFSFTLIST